MKRIVFHFDVISPFAYLAFEHLPQALLGLSYEVEYRPLLFAALLHQHGQLGPAEIASKREWTYRHVLWQARTHGIPLQMPARHPFNPLPLLRLALACGKEGAVNRYVAESVLRHVWQGGVDAADTERFAALRDLLAPARDPDSEDVKGELRSNTESALSRGVFGVPSYEVDGHVLWGFDALGMLRACVEGDAWFASDEWRDAAQRPGLQRKAGR
jgi:2-hydroxychromene-2-carboxylate isomerase